MRTKHHLRRYLPVLTALLLLLGACGSSAPQKTSAGGFYLDTYVQLSLYTDTLERGTPGTAELMELCADYEALFSKTREGSDIYRINHSGGASVEVSEETLKLLALARRYYELSGGQIDPTIGAVTELWEFHEDAPSEEEAERAGSRVPSAEALQEALLHVSFDTVQIEGNTVRLTDPDARLDLGFIAKGYIADRMRERLEAGDAKSPAGILDLGGNVVVLGDKPGTADGLYTVGIERPFGNGEPLLTIRLRDCAVVTSGTYERCFTEDGILYHHILDTQTGLPVSNGLCSVTIVCHDAADADALSTTCFVLGLEKGLALIESIDGAEALFIDEEMRLTASSGFPAYQLLSP